MDGSSPLAATRHRRKSLRRAVRLETEVTCELWDGAVPLLATNLSLHGIWLESELPVHPGSELSVSFVPPHWAFASPIHARACVVRASLLRRRSDAGPPGMGLAFVDLRADQSARLAYALHGLPPPLPRATSLGSFVLDDGSPIIFRAEAALLTGGTRKLASVPLTSAMTAITHVRRDRAA